MEGKFLMLVIKIISMGQMSFCAITIATPDDSVTEQNQRRYTELNFVDEPKTNFGNDDLSNSVNEFNSSLRIRGDLEPLYSQLEGDNTDQLNGGNNEYSPRGIDNHRRSTGCKNKRKGKGGRFRRRGGNGHGNRGGHREIGDRHFGGGGSQLGEASYGISAQAAVIGAGSTISGVAVTTGAII